MILILLLLTPIALYANTTKLTDINVSKKNVVLSISNDFKHRYFSLSNPKRLVVDLENTKLATSISKTKLNDTPI